MILSDMKISALYCFVLILFLSSCLSEKKEANNVDGHLCDIERVESQFPSFDVLHLRSYYLSAPVQCDSIEALVCYNYKEHMLDYIDVTNKQISQVPLQMEGPNAISRLTGIYAHKKDSIWLIDDSERISLVNEVGSILHTIKIKEYLDKGEELIVNTNHAMSTIHLYYNSLHESLLITVKDKKKKTSCFKVKEIFLDKNIPSVVHELSPSVVVPDISKGYANMSEPNVSFKNDSIIYNYPIESHIYVLNMTTGERSVIEADSRYSRNIARKCPSVNDYTVWQKHGFENPHFYDVMYLEEDDVYVRLHAGEVSLNADDNLDQVAYKRPLYLTIFNNTFDKLYEGVLPSNRYNPYTGWNCLKSGIIFFVDKIKEDSESLVIDVVSCKERG